MAYRVTKEPVNRAGAGVSRRRPDHSLTRNVTIASVTLGCLCLTATGVVLLGRDRDVGSLPNYVASHKSLKIAWVEPEQQAQFERNPMLAANAPAPKADVRAKMASRIDDAFDVFKEQAPTPQMALTERVPLPQARPKQQVAAIPLPRERVAANDDTADKPAEPAVTAALASPATEEQADQAKPPAQRVKLMSYAPTREMLFDKEITRDITGSIGDPARDLAAKPAVKLKTSPEAPPSPVRKPSRKLTIQGKLWGPVQVASLGPVDGIGQDRNGLPSAPYDRQTAVYVITDNKVYLPDGSVLEAHSGLGDKMDDPRFAHVRMRGVTPPHVYDLKMRESLFHGVEAIRMLPIGGEQAIFGRDGILAHSYMLGRSGQSNGCVAIKDYEAFLDAFKDGKISRLAVLAEFD